MLHNLCRVFPVLLNFCTMPKMFAGKSAYFHNDVHYKFRNKWHEHGGLEADKVEANFVFAAGFNVNLAIESKQPEAKYLVALIHPMYIEDCVNRGGLNTIPIGWYLLMPMELIVSTRWKFPEFVSYVDRIADREKPPFI